MPKNVLLAYISEVSGHRCAANAIEKALKITSLGVNILGVNLFNYTNPYSEKAINCLYATVIKRMPQIWEYLYDNPRFVKGTRHIRNMIHWVNSRKIKRLFDEFRPDVIAATQAFPCGMLADFKKIYRYEIPLIGVVTDFFPHSYWAYQNVDYYTVANKESKTRLTELGIEVKKIKLFGIPIDPKFCYTGDKAKIAEKLGIDLSVPVILVMGGGQGLGPIKTIVKSLDGLDINLQLIIVTGTNIKLCNELKNTPFNKKHLIFGYCGNIEELMDVASIIVTKPGGLTTSESLAKGVIPIIVNPIPGQEENNTRFLLKNKAAFRADSARDIANIARDLLSDKKMFLAVQQNIEALAKPRSALDIAELILNPNCALDHGEYG